MAVRQKTSKRPSISTYFPSRKVTPVVSIIPIHSLQVVNQKAIQLTNSQEHHLVAGSRAADNNNYLEAIQKFSLIKPETMTSLFLRGCARLELKRYSETQKAIEDFNHCIDLSSQSTQPSFAIELWYKRAFAYQNIGKNDDALRNYTEFINHCRSLREQGKDYLHKGLLGR